MATPADLPAVRALWDANTSWGTITDSMWQRYAVDPPFCGVTISLAEDDAGTVVRSFVFLPQLVSVNGRKVIACRPYAPVLSEAAQSRHLNPMTHRIIAMYLHTAAAAVSAGRWYVSAND